MVKLTLAVLLLTVCLVHSVVSDCSFSRDGKEEKLKNGERYCAADSDYRTCVEEADGSGKLYDDKCPEGAQCLELKHQVLCRLIIRNQSSSQNQAPLQVMQTN